jgi:4-hydroxy-tetrahydrodipicolinate reductase
MTKPITVAVHGALGKMGMEVVSAVCRDPELMIVGAVDIRATQGQLSLPDAAGEVPLSTDLSSLLKSCRPQVLVDFTIAEASISAARIAAKQGINLVIGTTGFSEDNLKELDQLCKTNKVGAVVAPNFTIGAAVLLHAVKNAAKFFDHAEIIELHHHEKADAPSGTALATAKAMLQSRGKPFLYSKTKKETLSGTRGGEVDGIAIHSVRLPGFVASQEVVFGGPGQTLSVRHDTIGRECYMPGVILAIKEVVKHQGSVYGLDALLNLRESSHGI